MKEEHNVAIAVIGAIGILIIISIIYILLTDLKK